MKLNYNRTQLLRALNIWPNLHGFDSRQVIPVETWTSFGLGVVFIKAPSNRAEVMRELRRYYRRRDLLGARLFDDRCTVLFLKQGHAFPRRPSRAEVIDRTA
ncbi:MAG: hypothetical protein PHT38_04335 [Halothiobacillus sp.]|jgi:hypothetical protein|nr:hypothetical protein [Halothiobacillus sp.]